MFRGLATTAAGFDLESCISVLVIFSAPIEALPLVRRITDGIKRGDAQQFPQHVLRIALNLDLGVHLGVGRGPIMPTSVCRLRRCRTF